MKYLLPNAIVTFFVLFSAVCASTVQAGAEPFTKFGEYTVIHTVFSSDRVDEKTAATHNLVRAKDRALLNLSIVKSNAGDDMRGLPAIMSGSVANLMQQRKELEFIEIREGDAVYYLAPFLIHNEEVLHFTLSIEHQGKAYDVKFTKKLYID
ncbi:MAG: DUF4426 domain-containing protein [Cellvibrionaceae bacterium]